MAPCFMAQPAHDARHPNLQLSRLQPERINPPWAQTTEGPQSQAEPCRRDSHPTEPDEVTSSVGLSATDKIIGLPLAAANWLKGVKAPWLDLSPGLAGVAIRAASDPAGYGGLDSKPKAGDGEGRPFG
jgi:hypothetical protein